MPRGSITIRIHESYIGWINEQRKYQPETGDSEASQAYVIEQCIKNMAGNGLPPEDTPGKILGKKKAGQ